MPSLADLYEPLTSASLPFVEVDPSIWETRAPWRLASLSGLLPEKAGRHVAPTDVDTIPVLDALVDAVVLPKVAAALADVLAVGAHETPARAHLVWLSFVLRPDGARLHAPEAFPALEVMVNIPSTVAGVPAVHRIIQVPGAELPAEAVATVAGMIDQRVVDAIKVAEGLP